MSAKERIRSLLKEAELYHRQSLLDQSRDRYRRAMALVRKTGDLPNREKLMAAIGDRLRVVEKSLAEIDAAPETPELSESVQELIRKKFSFSKNKDYAAIEGAVVLAKFGQHERALAEFKRLLEQGVLPVVAAKNIITCLLSFSSAGAAVAQFEQWVSRETLTRPQLKQVRSFIESILKKKGLAAELPPVEGPPGGGEEEGEGGEGALELSSITLEIPEGPLKGQSVEFDVTFQAGSTVNVIVPADQKDVLEFLKTGMELADIQCFSPIGFFKADGVLFGKTEIKEGPKRGDYLLEIGIHTE